MPRRFSFRLFAVLAAVALGSLSACAHPLVKVPIPSQNDHHGNRQKLDPKARNYVGQNGFWTKERLRKAAINGEPRSSAQASDPKLSTVGLGEGEYGTGFNFTGIPQIGTFFYRSGLTSSSSYHSCSGSVLSSASGTIVISAAHCWYGVNAQSVVFVPQFSWVDGVPQTPYGVWDLYGNTIYIDERYTSNSEDSIAYDVAIASIAPNVANQTIEEVTGGLELVLNADTNQSEVEIVGYPASDSDNQTYTAAYPRHCRNSTSTYVEGGVNFLEISCTGMASGISGGPWLVPNKDRSSWSMIGITGGGKDGGGYTDDESVGVPMMDYVTALIAQAESFNPSESHDWSRARHLAAGNFGAIKGGDDLVVGWLDQSVTLFMGSGNLETPFLGFRTLRESSSTEVPLRTLTTADLDGSGYDDLVALRYDGRVLLRRDPGRGARSKSMYLNPHSPVTWLDARQIIGGNFSPDNESLADDLMVVWKDGTTSVFLHVSKFGLNRDLPWPVGGLRGLKGQWGGENGPLAHGINGTVTAGDFGGGPLTDILVLHEDSQGKTKAWLIVDGEPEDGKPTYHIKPYDIEAAGVNPDEVISMAAGEFDSDTSASDVVLDMRGTGLLLLGGVKDGVTPSPSQLSTIVASDKK